MRTSIVVEDSTTFNCSAATPGVVRHEREARLSRRGSPITLPKTTAEAIQVERDDGVRVAPRSVQNIRDRLRRGQMVGLHPASIVSEPMNRS